VELFCGSEGIVPEERDPIDLPWLLGLDSTRHHEERKGKRQDEYRWYPNPKSPPAPFDKGAIRD
jgi:hypothetical protein